MQSTSHFNRRTLPIFECVGYITAVGLMNPITVTKDNTLIAGLHRLEAVKLLGWTENHVYVKLPIVEDEP